MRGVSDILIIETIPTRSRRKDVNRRNEIQGEADVYVCIVVYLTRFVLAVGRDRFAALSDNLASDIALSIARNGSRRNSGFVGSADFIAGKDPERSERPETVTERVQNKTPAIICTVTPAHLFQ